MFVDLFMFSFNLSNLFCVFGIFVTRRIHVCNCYLFLTNCLFYDCELPFFISGNIFFVLNSPLSDINIAIPAFSYSKFTAYK